MTGTAADLPRIRAAVSDVLDRFVATQAGTLAQIGDQLAPCLAAVTGLLAGGKRLRAAFCYWGWRALGGQDGPQIFAAAAALELLHASALIHDDVIDASDLRRGRPAVHRQFAAWHQDEGWHGQPDRFGDGAAILAGDMLLGWTDELFRASGLPPEALVRAAQVLDAMRTEVVAGQLLDLIGQVSGPAPVARALQVVTYKSAKYTVERPLQLGGALAAGTAGQPEDSWDGAAKAFTGYGVPIGIAFQLRDDILGVFGDPGLTGKPVSGDLREGKQTVLMALARERANTAQANLLRRIGSQGLSDQHADAVRDVITVTGALAACEHLIDRHVSDALAALDDAPITPESADALAELAIAATARSH